ncbi:hypothetical protein GPJ56_001249 [Histomonas meleagridis]|uniref:uncharacterized protein n=1 Tax=Histomonas meleagridis TaxID=135588 RepID=UPI003559CB41|nr:hypothetical protein GPJ56_001249 [Histomonas meleagridis]KAH0797621.1 hypothetical protein GO595_009250 [Histomonas meleagridis]
MNKKVHHAQDISKKHSVQKNRENNTPKDPIKHPEPNLYLFQITESLLSIGFTEEEIQKHISNVEAKSKKNILELQQKETETNNEIKKINRAIRNIKKPKPREIKSAQTIQSDDSISTARSTHSESPSSARKTETTSVQSYAEIQKSRQNPTPSSPKRKSMIPTPKKPKTPITASKGKKREIQSPTVQATKAGANFLAELANEEGDDLIFSSKK